MRHRSTGCPRDDNGREGAERTLRCCSSRGASPSPSSRLASSGTDGMVAFGDLARFPSDPSVFVDGFRHAWTDRGLGGSYPSNRGSSSPRAPRVGQGSDDARPAAVHDALDSGRVLRHGVPVPPVRRDIVVARGDRRRSSTSRRRYRSGSSSRARRADLVVRTSPARHRRGRKAGARTRRYARSRWFARPSRSWRRLRAELLSSASSCWLVWIVLGRDRKHARRRRGRGVRASRRSRRFRRSSGGAAPLSARSWSTRSPTDFEYTYDEVTPSAACPARRQPGRSDGSARVQRREDSGPTRATC